MQNVMHNIYQHNMVVIQKSIVWCVKKWVRLRYEGGVVLIGGTESNNSIGTISPTSNECNSDELQGWYYLSTINSAEYHRISISIVVSGGRVCESLLGCSCTMQLSAFATFNSVCTQCDYSICDDHKSQAPTFATFSSSYIPTGAPAIPLVQDLQSKLSNTTVCISASSSERGLIYTSSNTAYEDTTARLFVSLRYLPLEDAIHIMLSRSPFQVRYPSLSPTHLRHPTPPLRRLSSHYSTAESNPACSSEGVWQTLYPLPSNFSVLYSSGQVQLSASEVLAISRISSTSTTPSITLYPYKLLSPFSCSLHFNAQSFSRVLCPSALQWLPSPTQTGTVNVEVSLHASHLLLYAHSPAMHGENHTITPLPDHRLSTLLLFGLLELLLVLAVVLLLLALCARQSRTVSGSFLVACLKGYRPIDQ
mmetsp:Transcript_20537/g.28373  ORF Transcript_20537/g.28373 Transcript_20537/m.28373 type:complete len:421 (-) Transcript_20537:24-1286(-)